MEITLIKEFVIENYTSSNVFFPSGICPSCSRNLYEYQSSFQSKEKQNMKNAVYPDPEQQDISSVSKPIEIASSNDVIYGESFSELQLVSG